MLRGLALAAPGDPVLVLYEKLEPVLTLLERLGAERGLEPLAAVLGARG